MQFNTDQSNARGPGPLLVSVVEAAHLLGVSPRLVATLVAERRLRVVRLGRRVLVPLDALRELADEAHCVADATGTQARRAERG